MVAHVYIKGFKSVNNFNWDNCLEIPFTDYTINSNDFTEGTASLKSPRWIDTSRYTYAVKITNNTHPTFTGIIISDNVSNSDGNIYEYSVQDWSRAYLNKPRLTMKKTVYQIIKAVLDSTGIKKDKQGLLSVNRYEQKNYGALLSSNPLKKIKNVDLKDKTVKEILFDLVYEDNPLIRLNYNNTGVLRFTPIILSDFMRDVASFHYRETVDLSYNFNVADLFTRLWYKGHAYSFSEVYKTSADPFSDMQVLESYLEDDDEDVEIDSMTSDNANAGYNEANPYKTRNKTVYVMMDNTWSHSEDNKYLTSVCKELKGFGWKTVNLGRGSSIETNPKALKKVKNGGIWFMLNNGVDSKILRHMGQDKWWKGLLLRYNLRPVLGFVGDSAVSILRGGKCFDYLPRPHDASGSGDSGLKYPAGYLATCGVPFFYSKGNNPSDCAKRFQSGGVSKLALENNYDSTHLYNFYYNWNWKNKY